MTTPALWQRVFKEVAAAFPQIETQHMYVDALCMQMVRDPRGFDVIVTNNMFGDIITISRRIAGRLGWPRAQPASGKTSMFEPVHGSAPPIAGKILPTLRCDSDGAMMLAHLA